MAIPSATIILSTYTVSTGNNALVTFTFSEAVSGFALGDISAPNGTLSALVTLDNTIFTSTFTPTVNILDNTNVITIAAGSYISVSTSEAGLVATSSNYTVNTVSTTVPITTLTEAVVDGDGVFDQMMKAVNAHVHAEWTAKRITSENYPQVYLGALQTALTQAVLFTLQRPTIEKQTDSEIAKKGLIERQTKGFDDDAKQKLLKQALDSWSVAYSVAKDANSIPDAIKVNPIDSIMKNAMDSLAIVKTSNPLAEI